MYIGNVKINLNYYTGQDFYSDGSIESEILDLVKDENNDITKILAEDNRWPILYHLSPIRRNLLEGFESNFGSSVLEIGAGCGALTGLLCENASKVVAIELSKRRAEIIAHRHKTFSNLEIIIGNLNAIEIEENSFDCITLIGVLEYATQFTGGETPEETFLNNIKSKLKIGGKLIIAIENKFGLKYWNGSREDHTGRLFDGLENYPGTNAKARTFSKNELTQILTSLKFSKIDYYYPLPDYKMPTQVFSEGYLPRKGNLNITTPNYDMDKILLFNEKLVYENLVESGYFDIFANSFLVICEKV
ncbi:class I SAM-dependent methyltransferase [Paenibacillus aestuarii]|uniref:Class I SAM-dependent methyltransferase n=1 Tax=Paenibacillus aestuarii TaxID=516965 RepID=A0ABW0K2H6_9BACL|nr:class I SAM-dependent methyltransferase [Paenibacillus aestuarii]